MKRAKWKGPNICPEFSENFSEKKIQRRLLIITRNSTITPCYIGLKFKAHTGKNFSIIEVTKDMLGHKFGEFSPTRGTFIFKKKKGKGKG
jgi:small subunit ribosomal protein S19